MIDSALTFVDNLLTEGNSFEKDETITSEMLASRPGLDLVYRHVDLLIGQFTKRLECDGAAGACQDVDPANKQRKEQNEHRLAWQELAILCRVSELLVLSNTDSAERKEEIIFMMEQLCKLLMPLLRFDKRISESSQSDVLRILCSILPRIRTTTAISHFQGLSKLLGPNKSSAGITSLDIRQKIVSCLESIANHQGVTAPLTPVTTVLRGLCASNKKHVDEWDFDKLLPILNGLGNTDTLENTWARFASNANATMSDSCEFDGVKVLVPILYTCLHLLYDSDGVLNRCAFKALHSLIIISSSEDTKARLEATGNCGNSWLRLIETALVPGLKVGIGTRTVSVRRSFIRLLSEVSKGFSSHNSPHLYGDLNLLTRSDDEELDFFF